MKEQKSKENFNGGDERGGEDQSGAGRVRPRDEREDATRAVSSARVTPVLFCHVRKTRVSKRR